MTSLGNILQFPAKENILAGDMGDTGKHWKRHIVAIRLNIIDTVNSMFLQIDYVGCRQKFMNTSCFRRNVLVRYRRSHYLNDKKKQEVKFMYRLVFHKGLRSEFN